MAADDLADGGAESRALTGLRGLAAALVVAHHLHLHFGWHVASAADRPVWWGLLQKGYLGVDLFFVLSGFVLSMAYGRWFARGLNSGKREIVRFLFRRVARIWPLHAAVLLVLVVFGLGSSYHAATPKVVLMNAALVQAWGHGASINPPSWSISTELVAYAVFPGLALVALRGRVGPWLCLAGVAVGVAVCVRAGPAIGPVRRGELDIYFNYSLLPVLRCLSGFTLGMLAWRIEGVGAVRRLVGHPATGPLALAVFVGLALARVGDVLIYPLLPLIVLGMHHGRGPVVRALAVRPLHTLGVLSYSIYLIHLAMLTHAPLEWGPLPLTVAVYAISTALLAGAAHRLIEAPGRRLLRAAGEAALARTGAERRVGGIKPPLQDRSR